MKPILFSTPMVQAILDGRKTMTRRVIKGYPAEHVEVDVDGSVIGIYDQENGFVRPATDYAKYRVGDILWVRETWLENSPNGLTRYFYRADSGEDVVLQAKALGYKWRPSIFMPREACRIFLRVTEVRAERLQDITEEQAVKEGVRGGTPFGNMGNQWTAQDNFQELWDSINAKPKPQYETIDGKKRVSHYVSYPWEDVQETRTWRGKPWYVIGNPWIWVISFERCEKPEAADA